MKSLLALTILFAGLAEVFAADISGEKVYYRMTGFEYPGAESEISSLDINKVFSLAMEDQEFYENRVITMVSRMKTEKANPFESMGAYQAAIVLAIAQDIDFRDIFTEPFYIINKERDQIALTNEFTLANLDGLANLPRNYELRFNSEDFDLAGGIYNGLFTTPEFAVEFLTDGTNRKPIRGIYDIFLCSKIESYKDSTLDTYYVAPDIDRNPGDSPHTFNDECSACHVPLDSQRPSFAYLDEANGVARLLDEVSPKLNRNQKEFSGFITVSDDWENPLTTPAHMERFGWRGPTYGRGLNSFASMIVNAEQFSRCMAQRVSREFCDLPENFNSSSETKEIVQAIATDFEKSGYKFKELIKSAVRSPLCH